MKNAEGETVLRSEESDLGGTMRLGEQLCDMLPGSLAARMYGDEQITERHRHRFEFNNNYTKQLVDAGLVISARSNGPNVSDSPSGADSGGLVEMIEIADHPWFIGCQIHPEYTSNPRDGHPLFTGLITAALACHSGRMESVSQHDNACV